TVELGVTYYYVVVATNTFGSSANSAEKSIAASIQKLPPLVPTGVTATLSGTAATITWNASAGADSYDVLRTSTSGSSYAVISGGPYTVLSAPGFTLTTFDHTTAGANIVYYYQVLAANGSGSTPAPQLRFRAPPPVPTGLAASIDGSGRCAGCVNLSWSSAQR